MAELSPSSAADWWQVAIAALAAMATIGAVVTAFWLQNRQLRADRRLSLRRDVEIGYGACCAILDGLEEITELSKLEPKLNADVGSHKIKLQWRAEVLSHYLQHGPSDHYLVTILIRIRGVALYAIEGLKGAEQAIKNREPDFAEWFREFGNISKFDVIESKIRATKDEAERWLAAKY